MQKNDTPDLKSVCGHGFEVCFSTECAKPENWSDLLRKRVIEVKHHYEAIKRITDAANQEKYVPGIWQCRKCSLILVSQSLNIGSGSVTANKSPQECANNCGPMWRVTWKDWAEESIARHEKAEDKIIVLKAEIETLRQEVKEYYHRGLNDRGEEVADLKAKLQVAVEALEKIANHKQTSVDKVYLIHQCEGYQTVARKALDALEESLQKINSKGEL